MPLDLDSLTLADILELEWLYVLVVSILGLWAFFVGYVIGLLWLAIS
jgi:hypothetical protein